MVHAAQQAVAADTLRSLRSLRVRLNRGPLGLRRIYYKTLRVDFTVLQGRLDLANL
jgi:hypothetical protein